jgi:hypothetical protein
LKHVRAAWRWGDGIGKIVLVNAEAERLFGYNVMN